jgi:hypothetical protein
MFLQNHMYKHRHICNIWKTILWINSINSKRHVICGYLKSLKVLNTITIHGFLSCLSWLPCPPWLLNSYPSLIFRKFSFLKDWERNFCFFRLFFLWLVPLQSENFRLEFIYFLHISHFQIRGWGGKTKHICYILHHDALDIKVAMNVKNEILKTKCLHYTKITWIYFFHIMSKIILATLMGVCTLKCLIFWKINSPGTSNQIGQSKMTCLVKMINGFLIKFDIIC